MKDTEAPGIQRRWMMSSLLGFELCLAGGLSSGTGIDSENHKLFVCQSCGDHSLLQIDLQVCCRNFLYFSEWLNKL